MHAHTGVKTHLIGPRDLRMVARVSVRVPTQARARVERGHGSDGRVERRAWRWEGFGPRRPV